MTWPGCDVAIASSGQQALNLFNEAQPDIVVLDIEMPPPDGFQVCLQIREKSDVPILMLTVRDSTLDKIRALDLGADDYLTKPFDHLELLARLRALMRRATGSVQAQAAQPGWSSDHNTFNSSSLHIDFDLHEVRLRGKLVTLTSMEYRLLEELVKHAGKIMPHELLLERVWGPAYVSDSHYLKVFVQRLRRKLGDGAEQPHFIRTEWGVGYQFLGEAK
jgi:DNA-binding response OmpR family regulator